MASASFQIKKYINNVGFYCSIELDIIKTSSNLEIEFDGAIDDSTWNSSIEFGIKFFYEHYSYANAPGLSVTVKNIHTMTGDTSNSIVAYATIKCLCEALQYTEELITFDEANNAFVLKK